jgi:hypothetical protein
VQSTLDYSGVDLGYDCVVLRQECGFFIAELLEEGREANLGIFMINFSYTSLAFRLSTSLP